MTNWNIKKKQHSEILLNDIWSLSAFVLAWFIKQTSKQLLKGRASSTQQWSYLGPRYIYTLYTRR